MSIYSQKLLRLMYSILYTLTLRIAGHNKPLTEPLWFIWWQVKCTGSISWMNDKWFRWGIVRVFPSNRKSNQHTSNQTHASLSLRLPSAAVTPALFSVASSTADCLTTTAISFEVHTWLSNTKAIKYFMNWCAEHNGKESETCLKLENSMHFSTSKCKEMLYQFYLGLWQKERKDTGLTLLK